MTLVEGLAVVLAVLVLFETTIFLVWPKSMLDFARSMAEYRYTMMSVYFVLGAVLLALLLRSYSLAEILGIGFVMAVFYGVILMPYYGTVVEEFQSDHDDGTLWPKMAPGLLVWGGLSVGVLVEWWLRL